MSNRDDQALQKRPASEVRLRITTNDDQALINWMDQDTLYPFKKRQMIFNAVRAFWNPMVVAQSGATQQQLKQSVMASLEVLKSQQLLLEQLVGGESLELSPAPQPHTIESPALIQSVDEKVHSIW
jgi:hypothetical protein